MSQTQQRIIPAKQMTIVTTSGLAPRMEVTVTRPAYKTPKPSREEETEQMMQILNSREIKDMLIDRYDLANYYGITPNMKGWQSKLYEAVEGAVDIKRTKYGAIAISVKD